MKTVPPILYTKPGCPWCSQAREVLVRRGVAFVEKNVHADMSAFNAMRRISGQTKAPVLDLAGEILSDFGAAELEPFLDARPQTR
ncbi:MAG: glutaredoxin family protein [Opitutae bacterium]|nr:glutaredoxin family protein [Opitutae bacterium]